jgi:SAM-dependent methyltransferase
MKKMSGGIVEVCEVCNSKDIHHFVTTYDRHYGWVDKSFSVYKCTNCELLFLNPMISEEELHSMYSQETYYSYQGFSTSKTSFKQKILKFFFELSPKDLIFECSGKTILDIGCGSGEKLFFYKNNGAIVQGVEISNSASKIGNLSGLNIFNGTLLEARLPSNHFDYIRSNHSFEHLTNPVEVIKEMLRICKTGGKVFIGVPNTKSLTFKLFRKYWYYLGVPFHPFNYNPKNLSILLEKNNFEVDKIQYNGRFNGILGSIQIILNSKNKKKSDEGYFTNKFTILFFHQIARILNLIKQGDCIEIIATKIK